MSTSNGHEEPETLSDDSVTEVTEPTAPAQRAAPTEAELRELFRAWKLAESALVAAKAAVEPAALALSESLRAIVEAVGNKGPWDIDGERISVTVRGGKYHVTREQAARITL